MGEAEVTQSLATKDVRPGKCFVHTQYELLPYIQIYEGISNQNLKQCDGHWSRILKLKKKETFGSLCKTHASFRNAQTNTIPMSACNRGQLKCDGTRAETRFSLLAKRTSPFKSAGASVQSTTGSQGVCISFSNAGYTMFQSSVKSTGYLLHSPVSLALPLKCVTVCHHISTGG